MKNGPVTIEYTGPTFGGRDHDDLHVLNKLQANFTFYNSEKSSKKGSINLFVAWKVLARFVGYINTNI